MRDTVQNQLSYINVNPRKNLSHMKSSFSIGSYSNPLYITEPPKIRKNVNLSVYKESLGNSLQPLKNFEHNSLHRINRNLGQTDSIQQLLNCSDSLKIIKEKTLLSNASESKYSHKKIIIPNYTYVPKVTVDILPSFLTSQKPSTVKYSLKSQKMGNQSYSLIKNVAPKEQNGKKSSRKEAK